MSTDYATPIDADILPTFEEYVGDRKIISEIGNIHRFSFSVTYQKNGAITAPAAREALKSEGYAVLNDLLEATGLHYLDVLSVEVKSETLANDGVDDSDGPILEFRFGHDSQHCRFQFFEDRFVIERASSTLANFYEWYCNIMPSALRIEMTLRQIIETATSRPLRPVRSSHMFVFNFCEFWKNTARENKKGRNMDVLVEIIPQLPGNEQKEELTKQELHRLDLMVSKQEQVGQVRRNVWYRVEAPFNQGGRFIVFSAELRNSATERLEEGRVLETDPFDPDFGAEYRLALVDFLRDRALEGFARLLLGDWEFSTERNI